jgi:hypothetical protein
MNWLGGRSILSDAFDSFLTRADLGGTDVLSTQRLAMEGSVYDIIQRIHRIKY